MGWKIWLAKGIGKILISPIYVPWRVTMPNRSWSLRVWPRAAEFWRFSRFGLSSAEKTAIARLPGRYRDNVKKARNYQRLAKASGLDVDSTKAIRQITGPLQQRERLLQTSMFEAEHQAALAGASEGIIGTLQGEIVHMTKEEAIEMGVAQAMVAAVKQIEDAAQTHATGIMRAKMVELGQKIETVGDIEQHRKSIEVYEGPRKTCLKAMKQSEIRESQLRRRQPRIYGKLVRLSGKSFRRINARIRAREKELVKVRKTKDQVEVARLERELKALIKLRDEVKATQDKIFRNIKVLRAYAIETRQMCNEQRKKVKEALRAWHEWLNLRSKYLQERKAVAADANRFEKQCQRPFENGKITASTFGNRAIPIIQSLFNHRIEATKLYFQSIDEHMEPFVELLQGIIRTLEEIGKRDVQTGKATVFLEQSFAKLDKFSMDLNGFQQSGYTNTMDEAHAKECTNIDELLTTVGVKEVQLEYDMISLEDEARQQIDDFDNQLSGVKAKLEGSINLWKRRRDYVLFHLRKTMRIISDEMVRHMTEKAYLIREAGADARASINAAQGRSDVLGEVGRATGR